MICTLYNGILRAIYLFCKADGQKHVLSKYFVIVPYGKTTIALWFVQSNFFGNSEMLLHSLSASAITFSHCQNKVLLHAAQCNIFTVFFTSSIVCCHGSVTF